MLDVYVVKAKRTAVGTLNGVFATTPAAELGASAAKAALSCLPDLSMVEEGVFGNVLAAGLGMNVARQVTLLAGLAPDVPAFSVNKVCGSGLKAITLAAQSIRDGSCDFVLAGGTESMSLAPYLLTRARNGYRLGHGELQDCIIRDGLTDPLLDKHMAVLMEAQARQLGISREDQDAFALGSQKKWQKAQQAGVFSDEIVPVEIKSKKSSKIVDTDEHPRPDTSAEKLAALKPAFTSDGTVTAGNASGINDGAAAVLLASAEGIKKASLEPIARITGFASAGVEPHLVGTAPVAATRKLLDRNGKSITDFDLIELNEAFAAQSLACMRQLDMDPDKVNVHGGSIAIGHPIGASGARIVVTLLNAMEKLDQKTGLATLCIGGGMGMSVMFERV